LAGWRYAIQEVAAEAAADEAAAHAFALMDRAVGEAPTRASWECRRGCDFCCHLLVEVTPSEIEALLPRVTQPIATRIRDRARAAEGLEPGAYRRDRIRCAFLDDAGACLAYDARPLRCRAHVSASVETCERVFRDDVTSGAVPGDGWLASVGGAMQAGLGGALRELHAGLADRLDRPSG
jgi:hypothetical protein